VGTTPPDRDTIVALLTDFEKKYPGSKDLFPRALETRLEARVAQGQLAAAEPDLDAWLAAQPDGDRTKALSRIGRDLAGQTARTEGAQRDRGRAMARKVFDVLVREGGGAADRIQLADLQLSAGDAPSARKLYDEVLAQDANSGEALRGAARAAAAMGETDAALGYWHRVVDGSEPGGTAWYEARIEQVTLLKNSDRKSDACSVLRSSRGQSKTAGGDALSKRLAAMEPEVCG
jgi:tetratricopeptide (TPR) repeat protein